MIEASSTSPTLIIIVFVDYQSFVLKYVKIKENVSGMISVNVRQVGWESTALDPTVPNHVDGMKSVSLQILARVSQATQV